MRQRLVVAALLMASAAGAAERWRMLYYHDAESDSRFTITAFAAPSPGHAIASGSAEIGHKGRPHALVTENGGRTWTAVQPPDVALSVYFLDQQNGWLVGAKDIWHTADFGKTWRKLARAEGAARVWFLDPQHGWAVGSRKSVYETADGGATWNPVAVAGSPKTTPDYTVYSAVAFADDRRGLIAGWSKPPRRGEWARYPDWMDPENARPEWPGIGIMLRTGDGGKTWQVETNGMFGQITDVALAEDGRGLGLVEFAGAFDYPSEVYRIDWKIGKSPRTFRRRDMLITDILVPPHGPAFLAGVEVAGRLAHTPVPGKLKLFKSADMNEWEDVPADYRAAGRRAMLASSGSGEVWVATDTGMILKLVLE